jgi:hypothetical protein
MGVPDVCGDVLRQHITPSSDSYQDYSGKCLSSRWWTNERPVNGGQVLGIAHRK